MPEKTEGQKNPAEKDHIDNNSNDTCWINPGEQLRAGMTCPRCHQGKLAYNGLLQLTCPECGLTESGACT